jgi:hypothetical protein
MLFTQSALLWAQVNAPLHAPHHQQQACQIHQTSDAATSHDHCQQDCCKQDKTCTSNCLSACVSAGLIVLQLPAATTVFPYFHTNSHNFFSSHTPDGTYVNVLDRPPRPLA